MGTGGDWGPGAAGQVMGTGGRYGRTEDLAVLGAEVTLVLLGLLDVLDKARRPPRGGAESRQQAHRAPRATLFGAQGAGPSLARAEGGEEAGPGPQQDRAGRARLVAAALASERGGEGRVACVCWDYLR
jgi:hypothetical protein